MTDNKNNDENELICNEKIGIKKTVMDRQRWRANVCFAYEERDKNTQFNLIL